MKTAIDYPISIDYGYTGSPYSKAKPHRGRDLLTPNKTPLKIGNQIIALTGNSGSFNGITYGYHLHIQAGKDKAVQDTVNPAPYAFMGGTVVTTGIGKEWGKFVTILTAAGIYVAYCHLSEIRCKVGDIIGGEDMATIINKELARILLFSIEGKNGLYDDKNALTGAMDKEIDKYLAGKPLDEVIVELWNNKVSKDYRENYQVKANDALKGQGKKPIELKKGLYEVV